MKNLAVRREMFQVGVPVVLLSLQANVRMENKSRHNLSIHILFLFRRLTTRITGMIVSYRF